jgi:hypothetical protein
MAKLVLSGLREGDVLLYRSTSSISRWICSIDGSEVAHAGLYLGQGMIGEALIVERPGLNANKAAMSFEGSDTIFVRRLKDDRLPTAPIMTCAQAYLDQGNRYAYGQLLLAACICLSRKVSRDSALQRWVIRTVMQKATDFLSYWQRQGREPMICSEFVFRAYDEAKPESDDQYSLKILSQSDAAPRSQRTRHIFPRFQAQMIGAEQPNIHPDSLLNELKAQPQKCVYAAAAMAALPPPPSDAELDEALDELTGNRQAYRASVAGNAKSANNDEVLSAAGDFAAQLVESTAGARQFCMAASATPQVDTVVAALANFVTPGDLMKSPSLVNIGELDPKNFE